MQKFRFEFEEKVVHTGIIEVEAETLEEAKEEAEIMASGYEGDWSGDAEGVEMTGFVEIFD